MQTPQLGQQFLDEVLGTGWGLRIQEGPPRPGGLGPSCRLVSGGGRGREGCKEEERQRQGNSKTEKETQGERKGGTERDREQLGLVVHTCNLSTGETEAGGSSRPACSA